MFGFIAKPNEVARLQYCAIILDQLAFENQKLFMAVVTMGARDHVTGHAGNVEALALRQIIIVR